MMCFDLRPGQQGGHLFATEPLFCGAEHCASFQIMAAVMAAGMVPPIALALATTVRPKLFTEPELEERPVRPGCWSASFISEGAIPFAAADPLRVIPSMMAGGAVTGALSMALSARGAPHGGLAGGAADDQRGRLPDRAHRRCAGGCGRRGGDEAVLAGQSRLRPSPDRCANPQGPSVRWRALCPGPFTHSEQRASHASSNRIIWCCPGEAICNGWLAVARAQRQIRLSTPKVPLAGTNVSIGLRRATMGNWERGRIR